MTPFLDQMLLDVPGYANQIVHVARFPARPAAYGELTAPLPPPLAAALQRRGIVRFYAHQMAALEAARRGEHVGVVTATASGKTLCYQLPVLEACITEPGASALFLFPTKALAHDQLQSLHQLTIEPAVVSNVLDGDTPANLREATRRDAQIVVSNPDMLHYTLLPDHARWQHFFANLRYVVLDEAHTYRGVFGSHVALLMRRLRRVCAYYNAAPQFVLCSATSANPHDHLAALVGDAVTIIDGNGAPQGPRSVVLWNPPIISAARGAHTTSDVGTRRSTNTETASLLAHLVAMQIKTLAFCRSRRGVELVLRYARERSTSSARAQFAAYRAGYRADERRQLEHAFRDGSIHGMVSTNALELGVDIGGVDAVVIGGFPGTVASVWQQAGRAGRGHAESLAVLIAQDDPLDQFYMRHPHSFFGQPHEYARVAVENPYILVDQLRCAAAELPLHAADVLFFGPTAEGLVAWLVRQHELLPMPDDRYQYSGAPRPARNVSIRSAGSASWIDLRDRERDVLLERIPSPRAPFELYPGAIYLHHGESYQVEQVDDQQALARRVAVGYYTDTLDETTVRVLDITAQRQVGAAALYLGKVEVTRQVVAYRRKAHHSGTVLAIQPCDSPPQSFRTVAVWWTVPQPICDQVAVVCQEVGDALHAMEHAAIGMLPLLAQCDRWDIGGLSTAMHRHTSMATVFVYDGVPGGSGIAQIGYEQAATWWDRTRLLLADCPCVDGCPACVQSPKCGNGNAHLSKPGAATLAALLLECTPPVFHAPATDASADMEQWLLDGLRSDLDTLAEMPPGARRTRLLQALQYRIRIGRTALGVQGRVAVQALEHDLVALMPAAEPGPPAASER